MAAGGDLAFVPATPADVARIWEERWGGLLMVTPERVYRAADLTCARGLVDGREVAFVSWARDEKTGVGEVVSLDAFEEHRGYGRAALAHAESELAAAGMAEAKLFTTNPNVRAVSLYLRLGWRLVAVHLDAMDRVRELKPGVPLVEDGLPLQDMFELRKRLAA